MYKWGLKEAEGFLAGWGPDYVAVSHAGHGVNSYAITYHLVHKGLAVFAQEGWGGVYMNHDAQTVAVSEMLTRCEDLLRGWDAHRLGTEPEGRLLCLYSGLRESAACGWVPTTQTASVAALREFLRHHALAPRDALAHAVSLVEKSRART